MVEKEILKKIIFLNDLPEPVLDKISTIAQLQTFEKGSILFEQDQSLDLLYMLVSGQIFLKKKSASGKLLTLDKVAAGRTVGISALMRECSSSLTAVCAEPCTIITVRGNEMHELFEKDFKIGHILMLKVVKLFKSRMEKHTRQFLLSLAMHPEIKDL